MYISDTIVKQSQGQQAYDDNVDPAQGYNHAKFERSRFNIIQEKGTLHYEEICQLSSSNMCENKLLKIVVY